MKDRLQEIYNTFGLEHQKKKLAEECQEYLESPDDGEIADLYILTSQIYNHQPEVRKMVDYKIARTIRRIENKYYEGEIV